MKVYEDVVVPATTRLQVKLRTCDLCGKKSKGYGEHDWGGEHCFAVNDTEVTIRLRHGDSFPEGSSGMEMNIDICPECFKDKLIPWMNSQGADIETEEWDH